MFEENALKFIKNGDEKDKKFQAGSTRSNYINCNIPLLVQFIRKVQDSAHKFDEKNKNVIGFSFTNDNSINGVV